MNRSIISMRYAKALFQIGLDDSKLMDKIYADCEILLSIIKEDNALNQLLDNAIIPVSKKIGAIEKVFASVIDSKTLQFIKVVIENNRGKLLESMLMNFIDIYKENSGIKNVSLTTAISLSDKEKKQITQNLEKQLDSKLDISFVTDKDIIGGSILAVDGKQVDNSISGSLSKLKKTLLVN